MVKLTKIYTRTGDDGTTGLVSGARVAKSSRLVSAIGDVDELNATLGMARASGLPAALEETLGRIQNDLFDLGADLATPEEIDGALRIKPGQVAWLEQQIDSANADLPALTSFILPAGSHAIASLHLARAVARRAERQVWAAQEKQSPGSINPSIAHYLNRLSDFLFVAARKTGLESGKEVLWTPGKNQ